MSILKRKKQCLDGCDCGDTSPEESSISTWEEGRRWLREKGWRLVGHHEREDIYIHFEKENCVDLNITIFDAKTDLDAIRQVIDKVKAYEASIG